MGDQNQTSSEVSESTGLASVSPQDFLTEEEQVSDEATQKVGADEAQTSPDNSGETSKQTEGEKSLYVGKFKTEEDLKNAFAELGGKPEDYSDPRLLEEAYQVREREFSRTRQQMADYRKSLEEESYNQVQDESLPNKDHVAEVADRIDWSKINDAKDLFSETIRTVDQMYQARSGQDRQRLVSEVISSLERRETVGKELAEVEAEVPRLKSDQEFRDAFGHFISGQKVNGTFQNLKASLRVFLSLGEKIAQEVATDNRASEEAKGSAQMGESLLDSQSSSTTDEIDEIVDAYQGRKSKLFG